MLSKLVNTELEATVIGSLLLRGDSYWDLPPHFSADTLQTEVARQAFQAIDRLAKSKRPVEVQLVAAEAKFNPKQTEWLRDAAQFGTMSSVLPYAEQLLERRRRMVLRDALTKATSELGSDSPSDEIIAPLVTALLETGQTDEPDTETLRDALMRVVDTVEQQKIGKGAVVRSGFETLDRIVKIRKGNLFTIAAQAGTGKSTLAVNIAENVAKAGGPILIHSLEMDTVEIVGRMIARNAAVDVEKIFDDSQPSAFEWASISRAVETLGGPKAIPFTLNTRRHTLTEIERITEREHRKRGLALVVVDYLQLVDVPGLGKNSTDENRIGTTSRRLKLLAQRLGIPIIAVAQLNRELDKRTDKDAKVPPPPKLSDLRGSGRIEQDSNIVGFLHPLEDGGFRLTIAKQRLGRKAVHVNFVAKLNHAHFFEATRQDF